MNTRKILIQALLLASLPAVVSAEVYRDQSEVTKESSVSVDGTTNEVRRENKAQKNVETHRSDINGESHRKESMSSSKVTTNNPDVRGRLENPTSIPPADVTVQHERHTETKTESSTDVR